MMVKNFDSREKWVFIGSMMNEFFSQKNNIINDCNINYFLENLNQDNDDLSKIAITFFFGFLNKKELVEHIICYLNNENKFIKFAACYALSKLCFDKFENLFLDLISDNFEVNRFFCIQSLYKSSILSDDDIKQIRGKLRKCNLPLKYEPTEDEKEILKQNSIISLWHITHLNNLVSILQRGIQCRNKIKKYEDIADDKVISIRPLWSRNYVPLFFADNTPMLYVVSEKYGCENLVLLEIDPAVLFLKNTLFSDGNIATRSAKVYNNLMDLEELDWRIIFSRQPAFSNEWKRKRSAEVLVYDKVLPCYIKRIHFFVIYDMLLIYKEFFRQLTKTIFDEYNLNIDVVFDMREEGVISKDFV